jgi:hypothetical protein
VAWTMQPALLLLFLLPPPSSGALGLARRNGPRARCATDRCETGIMPGTAGNVVLADKREYLLARPVEQWIYLDQPVMWIDRSKGGALLPGAFPEALGVYMEMVKSRKGDVSDMTLAVLHDIRTATLD